MSNMTGDGEGLLPSPTGLSAGTAEPIPALQRSANPGSGNVAQALAHAFLAAPQWDLEGLCDSGARTLGARRRWLAPLVRDILGAYHRRPSDAPRELAAYIGTAEPFTEAVARSKEQRKPIRVAVFAMAEPGLREGVLVAAPIAGLADLAALLKLTPGELDWFADTAHWNRHTARGRLQHYRHVWLRRPGRTPRLLEIPGWRLRAIQRHVLAELLSPLPLHSAAHGFVPGRNAATGASVHVGQAMVINLDLSSFFAHVTAPRVYGTLRQAGYPEAVAHTLTGLCTHVVPPAVITAMPPGGTADERFALAQSLRMPHLPQGAPTSPALGNLSLRRLDSRLHGWAEKVGANYTRYADDLAFSGGPALARLADSFVRGAGRIVADEGHQLNRLKTRVRPSSTRQQVTGVVVNNRINAPRHDFQILKAILHNCVRHGPESQNLAGHHDFRAHLLGRITWQESLNPARGARLRREFVQISW